MSNSLIPEDQSTREHLVRILESSRFSRSPQLKLLLRYLVETTIAGEEIKERTIGVAVFRKPADWDTDRDSTVRTYANRLRTGLEDFYGNEGVEELVRIEIPKGTYVPRILCRDQTPVGVAVDQIAIAAPAMPVHRYFLEARFLRWLVLTASAAGIAVAGAFMFERNSLRPPGIVASQPLTRDGRTKSGPLFTDGINLYFREKLVDRPISLVSIPVQGGEVEKVPISLREPVQILGPVNERSSFLVFGHGADDQERFWNWTPEHLPEPLEPAPDGAVRITSSIQADVKEGHLRIREQGRPDRWVSVPGTVDYASWDPRHQRLRFTVVDIGRNSFSLWGMQGIDGQPKPVQDYPRSEFDGHWNSVHNVFTFLSTETGYAGRDIGDIWMADERPPATWEHPRLSRLTQGPIRYAFPVADPDGSHVFAIGYGEKAELVRYDAVRRDWMPYMDGISGFETDFSRDGRWIAYVQYPERTLWKVRDDGSERTQLTLAPFQAIQPQWSPNGENIAVMGRSPGGRYRVYLVSSRGGLPRELVSGPGDQGIPTWSSDGSRLVFGELLTEKPRSEMQIHVLDVTSRQQSTLPNSSGRWTPRWSPDGRSIAALTANSNELLLYDLVTKSWRSLARLPFIESPAWTPDSRQIYFKTALYGKNESHTFLLQRIDVRTGMVTPVADLTDLETTGTAWYGLTRDNKPLTLRSSRTTDIYSIAVPH